MNKRSDRGNQKRPGFWKTTGIGGLLFLLPLIVVGALLGQLVPLVFSIADTLEDFLPLRTPAGIALLLGLSVLILLLMCFGAGMIARRSLGKQISLFMEKRLMLVFPRYAIIKEQMAGSLGGHESLPRMQPVMVQFDDHARIAFETDRDASGRVVVYLPGSPDAWSGEVAFVRPDQVKPLDIDFGEAIGVSERLGRESVDVP